jgi:tight adherence protein B
VNPIYAIIIFAVLFAVVMIAISLGYRFIESQRKKQVEGMLNVVAGTDAADDEPGILMNPTDEDPLEALLHRAAVTSRIEKFIQQSGLQWTVTRLIAAMLIAAVAGGALGAFLRPIGSVFLGLSLGVLLIGSLPYLYLRIKRTKRLNEMEAQLPEALDFLARSMRAGHAFSISLEMLGEESPDPLGQEFRVLFNEQNLGAPIDVALANFQERVPLLDVRMFVSSVMLQRQTGGNLSEILIRLSHIIRERFRLKGQVRAASAHGRLTAAVLSVLPVILMFALLFVAPGYLQGMAADITGKWLIGGSILGQLLGYIVMRRIVNIKV